MKSKIQKDKSSEPLYYNTHLTLQAHIVEEVIESYHKRYKSTFKIRCIRLSVFYVANMKSKTPLIFSEIL